jgi:hypothetical protein
VAQRNYYQQFALEKKQEILHHRLWMVIIAFCSILIITCISVILYKRYVNADKERRRLVLLKKLLIMISLKAINPLIEYIRTWKSFNLII